jgi:hypothetical protein
VAFSTTDAVAAEVKAGARLAGVGVGLGVGVPPPLHAASVVAPRTDNKTDRRMISSRYSKVETRERNFVPLVYGETGARAISL